MTRLACIVLAVVALSGCYRMTYIRLSPPGMTASPQMLPEEMEDQVGWRTFLLFGWVGVGDEVDAAVRCGSVEHVQWINTRKTLFQGLLTLLTANLYSPWAGRVTCDHR
jgi:hypothetical protein